MFKNDKVAWDKITYLDNVMEHKNQPKNKKQKKFICFIGKRKKRKRLKDIDMDLEHKRTKQILPIKYL